MTLGSIVHPKPVPQKPSDTPPEVIEACREMIRGGSLSFSLASKFLPSDKRDDVFLLYGWCRFCDDYIDTASAMGSSQQLARLAELKKKTESALRGEPQTETVFIGLADVCRRYQIPAHYPLELLAGMEMDVEGFDYQTWDDLRLYCYRVAGVVGLMMSHVLGIRDEAALKNACDMGSAMQMTNISRDVREDSQMGRLYLPKEWLSPKDGKGVGLVAAVSRLLTEADTHYRSGLQGLGALGFRTSLAISAAASVYSEIGKLVRSRGAGAWDKRAVVPLWRKLWVIARDLPRWFKSRVRSRKGPFVSIQQIWRFQ